MQGEKPNKTVDEVKREAIALKLLNFVLFILLVMAVSDAIDKRDVLMLAFFSFIAIVSTLSVNYYARVIVIDALEEAEKGKETNE